MENASGNAGLRLLDACLDDVQYARYLLTSKRAHDLEIRRKVNWKDPQSGNSILHLMAFSDLDDATELLLSHGAQPNIKNKLGEAPLHWSARLNSLRTATRLLAFKADCNAQDVGGNGPLHCAVAQSNIEMVILLLEFGANVLLADNDGRTPLELAAFLKDTQTAQAMCLILLRHCQKNSIILPTRISKALRAKRINVELVSAESALSELQKAQEMHDQSLLLLMEQAFARIPKTAAAPNEAADPSVANRRSSDKFPDSTLSLRVEESAPRGESVEVPVAGEGNPPMGAGSHRPPNGQSDVGSSTFGVFPSRDAGGAELLLSDLAVPAPGRAGEPSSPFAAFDTVSLTTSHPSSPYQASHRPMGSTKEPLSVSVERRPLTMYDAMRTGELNVPFQVSNRQSAWSPPPKARSQKPSSARGTGQLSSPQSPSGLRDASARSLRSSSTPPKNATPPRSASPPARPRSPSLVQDTPFVVSMKIGNSGRVVPSRRGSASAGSNRNSFSDDVDRANSEAVATEAPTLLQAVPFTQHSHGQQGSTVPRRTSASANGGGGLRALAIQQASKARAPSISDPNTFAAQQQLVMAMMGLPSDDAEGEEASPKGSVKPFATAAGGQSSGAAASARDVNNSSLAHSGPAGQKMLIQQLLASLPQVEPLDSHDPQAADEELPYFAAGMVQQQHLLAAQVQQLQSQLQGQLQQIQQYQQQQQQQPQQPGSQSATGNAPRLRIPNIPPSIKHQHLQYQMLRKLHQEATTLQTRAFSPAPVVPFLPDFSGQFAAEELGDHAPDHLDVFVAVEHCFDCHLHSNQSLRHDTKTYVKHANAVLAALIRAIADSRLAVRLYALRAPPLTTKRLGAFEVTVSLRLNLPAAPHPQPAFILRNANAANGGIPASAGTTAHPLVRMNTLASSSGHVGTPGTSTPVGGQPRGQAALLSERNAAVHGMVLNQHLRTGGNDEEDDEEQLFLRRWVSTCLHSKLQSKSWPNVKQLEAKVVSFLEESVKEAVAARNAYNAHLRDPGNLGAGYAKDKDREKEKALAEIGDGTAATAAHPALEFRRPVLTESVQRSLTEQYSRWIERMKVPPVVERHHLDMDWPELQLSSGATEARASKSGARVLESYLAGAQPERTRHPAGPMLQFSLAHEVPQSLFERAVCEHFQVFDARLGQATGQVRAGGAAQGALLCLEDEGDYS